ncbi:MAG: IclR family transcriptional regulator [Lautropia sp.]
MNGSTRSLERGLAVLECFRPGVYVLAHREIVEKTGLPKATVTRLAATLCRAGYLVRDTETRGWRLGVPVLSLAHSVRLANASMRSLARAMAEVARATESFVALGAAHGGDMVYVETANCNRTMRSRTLEPGMRTPILLSSMGRAYLAGLPADRRQAMLAEFARTDPRWRPALGAEIRRAVQAVRERGYCLVLYSDGRDGTVAAPVAAAGLPMQAISIGFPNDTGRRDRAPAAIVAALRSLIDLAGTPPAGDAT